MTRLCFVRHGETDWNQQARIQGATDIPLNHRGRAQASAVADHLSGEEWELEWDHIYSSPLSRAYDTAQAIAERVGLETIHTDHRLQERSFGEAEGIHVDLYHAYYRDNPTPNIETWEEVRKRVIEAADEIVLNHPDSNILVVAHGGLIASFLNVVSGGEIGPGHPPLKNTCMNLFTYHQGRWRIEWYNRITPELEAVSRQN